MPTYRSSTLSSAVSSANSSLISEPHSGLSGASEKYRHDLRQREETIRNLKETGSLHEMEAMKWTKEHEAYEARISSLEDELELAQQVQAQLDEQKQENLLLKETIDRMRFDMDEMRNSASSVMGGSSGNSSAANTLSKSLGAELASKIKGGWGLEDAEEDVEDEGDSAETTVERDSDGEDVIQTIITRKKRVCLIVVLLPSLHCIDLLPVEGFKSREYDWNHNGGGIQRIFRHCRSI